MSNLQSHLKNFYRIANDLLELDPSEMDFEDLFDAKHKLDLKIQPIRGHMFAWLDFVVNTRISSEMSEEVKNKTTNWVIFCQWAAKHSLQDQLYPNIFEHPNLNTFLKEEHQRYLKGDDA